MNTPVHPLIAAATLFLALSTATEAAIAGIYVRAMRRLAAAPSIGERELRIFARPRRVALGQRVSPAEIEDYLRHIGYYARCQREPGCYDLDHGALRIWARYPELPDVTLEWSEGAISRIGAPDGSALDESLVEPETILTLTAEPGGAISRTVNAPIPFAALVDTPLADAIVASEDRWFLQHHGVDFPRLVSVPLIGGGASTITMQVARLNVLQDRSRTLQRKLSEIGVAMAMDRQYSKPAILTAYVNSVYVGASRGRVLHGFGAAAREFFGIDDVRQLTDMQAATLVALLNQPSRYLDDLQGRDDVRLRRQRNRVLRLMQRAFPDRYSEGSIRQLEDRPVAINVPAPSSDNLYRISRNFLDHAVTAMPGASPQRIYLTLDPALQRIAGEVVEQGLADLERHLGRAASSQLEAALVVTNPQSGEVLAMVGGRSYGGSQFNRAANARRQIGSIMKPFDYLAAFERAAAEKRTDISPATIVVDQPTVFTFAGLRPWRPANYGNNYAGAVTWRRALAESRNVAAVKVATWGGLNRVAALWESASGQPLRHIFPSMALGAVQASPMEVARAYSVFATGGIVRPLQTLASGLADGTSDTFENAPARIAREDTTRTVAGMMRAVFDEGTARGARARGFTLDAAGKTGTTDALRDAWFAGFMPDLLAVVWVGCDDDQPLGLSGAQAALPIWTEFMKRAYQER